MKPGFALSLSPDGISLLHRAAGGWRLVGSVELESSDLAAALANLRAQAEQLDPGPISCKLIIPNSQVRYLTVDTGLVDDGVRMDMARAALDGATPYAVTELAFDLSQDGPLTHVAAVAIETLEEAEVFANDHGFGPTSFVAAPGEMAFLGEPFFGTARAVRGTDVEPDGIAVVNIGPAKIPETVAEGATKPQVEAAEVDAQPMMVEPQLGPSDTAEPNGASRSDFKTAPIVAFSSRRHKPETAAPPLQGASRASFPSELSSSAADTAPLPQGSSDLPLVGDAIRPESVAGTKAPPLLGPAKSETPAPSTQLGTDPDDDPATAAPITAPTSPTFLSRRQAGPDTGKAPQARPVAGLHRTTAKTATQSNQNDPFALREPSDIGGKPRFLGLVLIAGLLLFMAVAAAWAVYSNGTLFFVGQKDGPETSAVAAPSPEPTEAADQPQLPTTAPIPAVETTPDQLPEIIEPQVSALPENLTARAALLIDEEIQSAALTGPDMAVLDALQEPAHTDLDPEAIADGVAEIQGGARPALSQAAQYAAVGIWQSVPQVPELPAVIGLDALYVASIDHTDLSQDAVALPPTNSFSTDSELDFITSPTAAGSAFDLDERGLVRATPEGTLNPDGVIVYLGHPSTVPPPTPNRPDPEAEAEISEQQAILARLRPRLRPGDLIERAERAQLGGLSLAELGQKRPRARPASSRPANEDSLPTTEQAIATSVVPKARPVNFANLVDRAQRNTNRNTLASAMASTAGILTQPTSVTPTAVAPVTVTPSIPTSASVARQATMENAINLRKVNLIGVYGTPSNRRALVRLSSGRYKKVKVGDRIDGGQVVAIGDAELRYQKGGRNVTLKIPKG
ncbi:MAG: hypothetical protein COB16_15640 [Rhodobacteraceae bacterium]|nr:MAG: hypothetical protein COB16_15640 [Paracoccaceae bacterium]